MLYRHVMLISWYSLGCRLVLSVILTLKDVCSHFCDKGDLMSLAVSKEKWAS